MRDFKVSSYKYGINLPELAKKRFGSETITAEDEFTFTICGSDENRMAKAVSEMLLCDVAQFELADMVNEFPLDLPVKKRILKEAVALSKKAVLRYPVTRALAEYFSERSDIVLEGFVLFRMGDTCEIWERCVTRCIEDYIRECRLQEICAAFFRMISDCTRVLVVINKNSSVTLTNSCGAEIDYPKGCEESLIDMLRAISPDEILLYDTSDGKTDELIRMIKDAFGEIVVIG